jgi:hypothetical protein
LMSARVRSRAKLLSPLYDFSMARLGRFNELTIYVNGMDSSASFYKFKFQSAVGVEAQESDRSANNGRDSSLIFFR